MTDSRTSIRLVALFSFVAVCCLTGSSGARAQVVEVQDCPDMGSELKQNSLVRMDLELKVKVDGAEDKKVPFKLKGKIKTKTKFTADAPDSPKKRVEKKKLSGKNPKLGKVKMKLGKKEPSKAKLKKLKKRNGECSAADVFFDVFVDVDIPKLGVTASSQGPLSLRNDGPVPIRHERSFRLRQDPDQNNGVPLLDVLGRRVATIQNVSQQIAPILEESCPEEGKKLRQVANSELGLNLKLFETGKNKSVPLKLKGKVVSKKKKPEGGERGPIKMKIKEKKLSGKSREFGDVKVSLAKKDDKESKGKLKKPKFKKGECASGDVFFDIFLDLDVPELGVKGATRSPIKLLGSGPVPILHRRSFSLVQEPDQEDVPLFDDSGARIGLLSMISQKFTPSACPVDSVQCLINQRDGSALLSWEASRDCTPCDGIRVTRTVGGSEQAIYFGSADRSSLTDSLDDLRCPVGAASVLVTYCITCLNGDAESESKCCEIEVPCSSGLPPCKVEVFRCSQSAAAAGLDLVWEINGPDTNGDGRPDCSCVGFEIRDVAGTVIAEVAAAERQVFIPCSDLRGRSSLCIDCIGENGQRTSDCCDFEPCPGGGGGQLPGDCTQDSRLDISDLICLVTPLFVNARIPFPCGNGSAADLPNQVLLDSNGDNRLDISDALWLAAFQFGTCSRPPCPPHVGGTQCVPIAGCPDSCR